MIVSVTASVAGLQSKSTGRSLRNEKPSLNIWNSIQSICTEMGQRQNLPLHKLLRALLAQKAGRKKFEWNFWCRNAFRTHEFVIPLWPEALARRLPK